MDGRRGPDALTREQMNLNLQRIWLRDRNTVPFITHSIEEAVLLSDRVVVMSSRPGRIADIVTDDLPRPVGDLGGQRVSRALMSRPSAERRSRAEREPATVMIVELGCRLSCRA